MDYDDMTFEEKFNYLVDTYPQVRGSWLRDKLYSTAKVADGLAPLPAAPPDDYEAWAYWILDSPAIMELMLQEGHKIHSIKEVRAATYMGLKESKDAVDHAYMLIHQGIVGKREAERLDKEVKEVIASLTGGKKDE